MKDKKNMSLRKGFTVFYILVALGIIMFLYDFINEKRYNAYKEMNMQLYTVDSKVEEVNDNIMPSSTGNFIGTIKIPKINLEEGFVSPSSINNTISKNIEIVDNSDMPDKKNGNFILIGNSGTSYISYFKNLYKLNKGDKAYIAYDNNMYEYIITDIYFENKSNNIKIYRDKKKQTLTLITSTKNDEKKQTIYIAELKKVIKEG